jgi:hypothetical protein
VAEDEIRLRYDRLWVNVVETLSLVRELTVYDNTRAADPLRAAVDCRFRMYTTYVPNKTISLPDDVVPIIERLDVPFSRWVTEQLRRHAAQSTVTFAQQLLADAALAEAEAEVGGAKRPSRSDARAAGGRMEQSASW